MQYRHFYVKNAYNEIRTTIETLLEQRSEAGLGLVLVMEMKSSLESKYGPLRAVQNKACCVLLCHEKFSLSIVPRGKELFFELLQ